MSKVDELKQRLQKIAYEGMNRSSGDYSDNIGYFLHNEFNKPGVREEIMGNVHEDDRECKDEATCGMSSRVMKKRFNDFAKENNLGIGKNSIKEIAGTYIGPGVENSQAVKFDEKDKPFVGHTWLELPDESIVDASAGQFINQKYKPLKQRQRFRIIPKESGLHKYYKKDKLLQNMIDTKDGREELGRIHKLLFGKLKQRLAAIGLI